MGIIELLALAVLAGLGVFYVAQTLIYDFDDEGNNNGPFRVPNAFVHNELTAQSRPAHFFDIVRLAFGFYRVEHQDSGEQLWYPKLTEVRGKWACPHCLGFWVAVAATIFFFNNLVFSQQIMVLLAATGVNSVLVHLTEGCNGQLLEVQNEEGEIDRDDA